ncbi:copper chaperone PCu(A)C [Halobacteriovorax sp. GB3]|uniref:copper chaperone PCu(A)C n=1 Tax=Halobacteriovorax sp. GB3 TaxID=2719615 RepID=UPI00235E0889|nr:copper chaperone PCu(A)C [Halobacteriovorax sp. GB3]MDD0854872.1 copper chaperone PCu(A)C [Halobacteriovorax sp. GB3]
MKKIVFALFFVSNMTLASGLSTMAEWVKAVPASSKMSAAYFHIHNETDKSVDLVKASSSYSKVVEIHTHVNDKGVMKMRKVSKLPVPSKGMVMLEPKGNHLMLIGLKKKIGKEDKVDITLEFSNGEKLKVMAPVKKLGGHGSHDHDHSHHH